MTQGKVIGSELEAKCFYSVWLKGCCLFAEYVRTRMLLYQVNDSLHCVALHYYDLKVKKSY